MLQDLCPSFISDTMDRNRDSCLHNETVFRYVTKGLWMIVDFEKRGRTRVAQPGVLLKAEMYKLLGQLEIRLWKHTWFW